MTYEAEEWDYQTALKAAGAEVHNFMSFGSYQGDWLAKVTYKGKTGLVHGTYGSCSGCDAFEAEFGWSFNRPEINKSKLITFGKQYLEPLRTYEELKKELARNIEWDTDVPAILKWLEENKP